MSTVTGFRRIQIDRMWRDPAVRARFDALPGVLGFPRVDYDAYFIQWADRELDKEDPEERVTAKYTGG